MREDGVIGARLIEQANSLVGSMRDTFDINASVSNATYYRCRDGYAAAGCNDKNASAPFQVLERKKKISLKSTVILSLNVYTRVS